MENETKGREGKGPRSPQYPARPYDGKKPSTSSQQKKWRLAPESRCALPRRRRLGYDIADETKKTRKIPTPPTPNPSAQRVGDKDGAHVGHTIPSTPNVLQKRKKEPRQSSARDIGKKMRKKDRAKSPLPAAPHKTSPERAPPKRRASKMGNGAGTLLGQKETAPRANEEKHPAAPRTPAQNVRLAMWSAACRKHRPHPPSISRAAR
ncbi:hypothetical protein B0H14DRAFT_3142981 [Mycena olivaceomarginata]|nr:hypothetical protein B0H14DRAFT_3142981 [Mycena olivaceomarginata]